MEGSPLCVRVAGQIGIEITRILRHFVAQPAGFLKGLHLTVQLHLGHHQAGVIAGKVIHFPSHTLVHQHMPGFFRSAGHRTAPTVLVRQLPESHIQTRHV